MSSRLKKTPTIHNLARTKIHSTSSAWLTWSLNCRRMITRVKKLSIIKAQSTWSDETWDLRRISLIPTWRWRNLFALKTHTTSRIMCSRKDLLAQLNPTIWGLRQILWNLSRISLVNTHRNKFVQPTLKQASQWYLASSRRERIRP